MGVFFVNVVQHVLQKRFTKIIFINKNHYSAQIDFAFISFRRTKGNPWFHSSEILAFYRWFFADCRNLLSILRASWNNSVWCCCSRSSDLSVQTYLCYISLYMHCSDHSLLPLIPKFTLITELILKIGTGVYTLVGGFYVLVPIYVYYSRRETVPLIPLFFPFIDENTSTGFAILTAIHLVYIVLAIISTACTDFMFIMIIYYLLSLLSFLYF